MTEWRELSGPLAAVTGGVGQKLLLAHGFTQTGNSWRPLAEHFVSIGYQVIVVDMPGHGDSSLVRADLRRGADMLASLTGEGTYVGYSMGGRFCMHAALMYPHLVKRLILLSTNPGIDDADERARRRASDDALIDKLYDIGVEEFLNEWSAQPLFQGLVLSDAERTDRLRNTVEGLASSLRLAGTGAQTSLWRRLRELTMPVLAIAGALDTKYVDIAKQIAAGVPRGKCTIIDGASHAVHLQQPAAVAGAMQAWLQTP